MTIQPSRLPLQRLIHALPKPLRRIKLAKLLATLTNAHYQRLVFQQGELIANIRDAEVANSLVRGTFADYGYFDLARRLLTPGDTHVDLGANYGFHTFGLLGLPIAPTLQFILIDANPDCVACLHESAKLHPTAHLKILHTAASATPGQITFAFASSATGAGHIGQKSDSAENQVTVPSSPLDDLFEKNNIDKIALLKMDIEGSEPMAMQGLSRMLSTHRVNYIYFEVNPACLQRQHSDPPALFSELTRHGYRLFWPHDDLDWIQKTFGESNPSVTLTPRFTISAPHLHPVIEFDQSRYNPTRFGQCDLLAVSPTRQIARCQ
jgi:FkbM family methyltransferase